MAGSRLALLRQLVEGRKNAVCNGIGIKCHGVERWAMCLGMARWWRRLGSGGKWEWPPSPPRTFLTIALQPTLSHFSARVKRHNSSRNALFPFSSLHHASLW